MPIRYSNVVGGSSSTGFNLDVGSSGNTTFYFDTPQPAGGYSITSQLADSTIEFYAIAEDGTLAGYTNTKALSATKDFDTLVVYGATTNDLITFEYKSTTLPTASGDQDSGAAPFITSVSDADLANIDDTTIITGGNFATDVAVTFTGTDAIVRNPKSVVRTNSTQLIVTRPDDFLEDNSPYTITVSNPGITQSAIITNTSPITAGGDPVWATSAGQLPQVITGQPYSITVEATDPDGGAIVYAIVAGQLPQGLSLNTLTGEISGTSPAVATQSFTLSATDSSGNVTNRSFDIAVDRAVTGGTISESGGYAYHTFTSSGTLSVAASTTVEAFLVGGGGGGGVLNGSGWGGGGGGAGGYVEASVSLSVQNYSITVGAGGSGGSSGQPQGSNGENTSAFSLTAFGGGGGAGNATGNNSLVSGSAGASGGGGGTGSNSGAGGSGGTNVSGQGFAGGPGGNVNGLQYRGGGGGGASQVGGSGLTTDNYVGAPGGDGISSYSSWGIATNTGQDIGGVRWFGGGGGGSSIHSGWTNAISNGAGGKGGGGEGAGISGGSGSQLTGSAGLDNTGGGGGGSPYEILQAYPGGSGIVIIRYPV